MADLFEFLIGTGMRKGEALGRLRAPAPPAFTTTANQPRTGRATTMAPDTPKAALSWMRERPPTCSKHGRDDRI
ncbi:hypothetical protein GCM10010388_21790 [Streptomyces mauvecolor]